jgi:putative membrane protein
MQRIGLYVALVMVVLVLILILQNLESCTTRFLFFEVTLPRALMLFIAVAAGFAMGLLVAVVRSRRKDGLE